MQQALWRIELLGWLRAEREGAEVTRFATHNTAALLARLALWPRRAHSREELSELLWPEVDSDAARGRLRQALTSLRHQLEPPGIEAGSVLIADRTHIRLNPTAIATDVAEFDAAIRSRDTRKACELYKGDLLPGYYEDWVQGERERLEALFEQIRNDCLPVAKALDVRQGTITYDASPPLSTSPSILRLPLQFTRFFGRTEELTQIEALLSEHRLVTLTGPGGAGKTRLSIETARRYGGAVDIVFVGLADAAPGTRLEQMLEAVLDSLHFARETTSGAAAARPALERLIAALSSGETLLVLDNAEHVAVPAAQLALILLSRVPTLRILATSRRRLHIAGEREFPVPPLLSPPSSGAPTPEELAGVAAVQLFVDRAQAVRPDFQLTRRNAADIDALCRRLEGAPLAIELAAARAATLTPAQMVAHLAQRFEFLVTRRADKDARHRSLWAAISWSVSLLPPSLASLWTRLAVFRGGFTADTVAAVAREDAAVEALTQLRERSLIVLDATDVEMRFRLPESLREFAELEWDSDDRREVEKRHAEYYLSLAQVSETPLRGGGQAEWLARLEAEHDNLRAALAYGICQGDTDFTQQLAGSLWVFWERRGHLTEARAWLERALLLPGTAETTARALALNRLGATLNYCGSLNEAAEIHEETLAIYLNLGDERGVALAWNRLGYVAAQRGDNDGAFAAFTEALAREQILGNQSNMAAALVNLGIISQKRAAYGEAREYYARGLALYRALENLAGIADTWVNLASVSLAEAHWEDALPYLRQAAATFETLGDRWSGAYVTLSLAIVARNQDRLDEAASLANAALIVCREVGDRSKVGDALYQLALIARQRGDKVEAARFLREALPIYRDLGQIAAESNCLHELECVEGEQG